MLHDVTMKNEDDTSPLTRDIAPFGLRMPPAIKSKIKASADKNNRSMNAEIVSAIEFYLDFEDRGDPFDHFLNQEEPPSDANPTVVSTRQDVETAVARLTDEYAKNLKRAMMGMISTQQEEPNNDR